MLHIRQHHTLLDSVQCVKIAEALLVDMWQRVKTGSKAGFDKAYATLDKLGPPINNLSNKLGSEAFWPTALDKESDKAARILKSFCSKTGADHGHVMC